MRFVVSKASRWAHVQALVGQGSVHWRNLYLAAIVISRRRRWTRDSNRYLRLLTLSGLIDSPRSSSRFATV
jgi:hypothetical protein